MSENNMCTHEGMDKNKCRTRALRYLLLEARRRLADRVICSSFAIHAVFELRPCSSHPSPVMDKHLGLAISLPCGTPLMGMLRSQDLFWLTMALSHLHCSVTLSQVNSAS